MLKYAIILCVIDAWALKCYLQYYRPIKKQTAQRGHASSTNRQEMEKHWGWHRRKLTTTMAKQFVHHLVCDIISFIYCLQSPTRLNWGSSALHFRVSLLHQLIFRFIFSYVISTRMKTVCTNAICKDACSLYFDRRCLKQKLALMHTTVGNKWNYHIIICVKTRPPNTAKKKIFWDE